MTESLVNLDQKVVEQRQFMVNVYIWMAMGLFLTTAVSYIVSTSAGLVQLILANKVIFYGLLFAELLLVGYFSVRINKMSANSAMAIFLAYSAMNGVTLSLVFLLYTAASIVSTFFVTGGTFAIMSLYGYFTKRDLTNIGNICFMGLIGVILASVVNIFMHSSLLYWVTTYIGILIFVGLTAYDTQKIKKLNNAGCESADQEVKRSINGALILYLDFINLFLYLLSIFGRKK